MRLMPYLLYLPLCLPLFLTACNGDDDNSTTENTNTTATAVEIPFSAEVNAKTFTCGTTYTGVGNAVTDAYKINDFRFYVSAVQAKRNDGTLINLELVQDGKWQYKDVALLDFENGCVNGTADINTKIVATLPAGEKISNYQQGICLKVGLAFDENHSDPASIPSPLNVTGMLWSWTTGRKFIRVDGIGDPEGLKTNFHLHLGSTGCSDVNKQGKQPDAPCTYANTPQICLDNYVLNKHTIVADIGHVLRQSNVAYNTPNTAAGCMSGNNDPECQAIFPLLGLDFIYNDGANPAITYPKETQTFFSVK
ncbi:AZL_007920/MXAN_0976 family protein [Beggiatoa alba B18LD]|uniref:AZL_007920/MXAN_0976 family protein n=1 Tax=Beggiatoa alba B18LD TaxID=395493 RepID=I3CCX5_9GAMM|nr:MbnP family copper-binding protein [Beggiatoa alba]EIJ41468.1 AZL_007920/MXAN_0976 family protein [Beggiatoa alba B18LD]